MSMVLIVWDIVFNIYLKSDVRNLIVSEINIWRIKMNEYGSIIQIKIGEDGGSPHAYAPRARFRPISRSIGRACSLPCFDPEVAWHVDTYKMRTRIGRTCSAKVFPHPSCDSSWGRPSLHSLSRSHQWYIGFNTDSKILRFAGAGCQQLMDTINRWELTCCWVLGINDGRAVTLG